MYVAVKGGEKAIDNAHRLLARKRRGDTALPELSVEQIRQQMPLAVSRVMTEGSLYDEQLAALAIKQAAGDLMEAIFLLRAYRTTLPRFAASLPLDTAGMRLQRRISATYKDLPGGQLLGPTFDYTHRLLDFSLLAEGDYPGPEVERGASLEPCPRVLGLLDREGLMTPEYELPGAVPDITREPLDFPTGRAQRLQALARGDGASFSPWAIRPSAATAATIRSPGRSASAPARSGWSPRNSASRCRWARSRSPSARWSTSSSVPARSCRNSPVATAWPSATPSARRWAWPWSTAPCAPRNTARRWCRRRSRKSSS